MSGISATLIAIIASIVYYVLFVYLLALWARLILELARGFLHGWRPRGLGLVAAEFVYLITDPPILFVRRLVPPMRLGGMALDFASGIVMIAVIILIYVALPLMRLG